MIFFKRLKNTLFLLLAVMIFTVNLSVITEGSNDEKAESGFTGHWQFVNTMQDIPCCGHVLLSHAKDTSKIFYGSLNSKETEAVTTALEKKNFQINDKTTEAFMLIQDADLFYVQLSNGKYLKINGNLVSAGMEETDKLEEATAFKIELSGYGVNNYAYYRIYLPYGLSDLSLVVSDGTIGLSSACYSGFYMMAEATKIKEPPFGNLTKMVRFLAIVVDVALICAMLYAYRKGIINLISFGISSICIIGLLVFFMIFAITTVQPGLYVLHESTFETKELSTSDSRSSHNSSFEILEDGSAIFSFEGEEGNGYIWGCSITDENVFTTTSSGNYANGVYTIWLRPFSSGTYDVVFYYYDVTKDISTTKECKTYHIEVDENKKITHIEQHMGEV